jgi:uncharacterized membrane protein YqjE
MPAFLNLLPKVVPVAVRHLAAYIDLAAAESANALAVMRPRLLGYALTFIAALFTLLMGCLWIMIAVWDTAWRGPTAGLLFAAFMLLTIIGVLYASRAWLPGTRPFERLRSELERDQQLLSEMTAERDRDADRSPLAREESGHDA